MNARIASLFVLVLTIPNVALAQATFRFRNYEPSFGINAPVFDGDGNRLFGTNYLAVLYGGPTMDSLEIARAGLDPMNPHPFTRIENGQAGYFGQGGFVMVDPDFTGNHAWLQVRAWDARLGATYEEVAALGLGGFGESSLFYTTLMAEI